MREPKLHLLPLATQLSSIVTYIDTGMPWTASIVTCLAFNRSCSSWEKLIKRGLHTLRKPVYEVLVVPCGPLMTVRGKYGVPCSTSTCSLQSIFCSAEYIASIYIVCSIQHHTCSRWSASYPRTPAGATHMRYQLEAKTASKPHSLRRAAADP